MVVLAAAARARARAVPIRLTVWPDPAFPHVGFILPEAAVFPDY